VQGEVFARFSLKRSRKVVDLIQSAADPTSPWVIDQQFRVLVSSMEFALKYAPSDIAFANGSESNAVIVSPFAEFGLAYSDFLMKLNESVLDSSVRYNISIFALGLFQWDLYRDAKKEIYAPAIVKIHDFLEGQPTELGASGCCDAERIQPRIRKIFSQAQKKVLERDLELAKAMESLLATLSKGEESQFSSVGVTLDSIEDRIAACGKAFEDAKRYVNACVELKCSVAKIKKCSIKEDGSSLSATYRFDCLSLPKLPTESFMKACLAKFEGSSNEFTCVGILDRSVELLNACASAFSSESYKLKCIQDNPLLNILAVCSSANESDGQKQACYQLAMRGK